MKARVMMRFVNAVNTTAGRAARVAVGLVLIAAGIATSGVVGSTLAVVGLVPLAAGLLNVCLLGPLFHAPLRDAITPR